MFCHKCGKELANDSLFCQRCGTPVITQAHAEPVPEATPTPPVTPAAVSVPAAPEPSSSNGHSVKKERRCRYCGNILESEKKTCSFCGKPQRKATSSVLILISALLLLALAGLSIYQHISYRADLSEKNASIEQLTADNHSLTNEVSDLTEKISNLRSDIADMKLKLGDMNKTVQTHATAKAVYQNISSFFSSTKASTYNKYKDYFANTNIIVVREGKTATVSITYKGNDTIWMDAEKDYYIDYEWSHSWSNDTTKAEVTGKNAGSTILTFSKEDSSDKFYVLVVVVE